MLQNTQTPRETLKVGFVALADCAPLVMAQELGLFAAHGLDVELHREIGWATMRDKIIYGELHAAQAPAGLVVSANCGLGCIQADCLTGLVLNLHGNAITLSSELWKVGVRDGPSLRTEIERGKRHYTFGVVHPFSSHNILLRNWLRANRIVSNVRIVVVPPAQMHANIKAGNLDGYCVGEPWNSVAVLSKAGWCVATSAELAPGHIEKVLMVRREFAETSRDSHLALIAALAEACRYCDELQNRNAIVDILSRREFVGASRESLRLSLSADGFNFGNGRIEPEPDFHIFANGNANEPTLERAQWLIRGLHATGIVSDPASAPLAKAAEWFRRDIFKQALNRAPKYPVEAVRETVLGTAAKL
ncbi:MAG: Nitrate transporter, ATP-binding protein NtrC [Chthoniobacteraceae bacterium]|nr:Nitrate transporter, ATP-binding protein NtrC [Chthoniobacteraceae bacterium]